MIEKKSFLTTVDVFLTKSRQVLVNIVTAFFFIINYNIYNIFFLFYLCQRGKDKYYRQNIIF
jgi:magnesium-transporting ATPase (P-type)